jgi:hypothetical protein
VPNLNAKHPEEFFNTGFDAFQIPQNDSPDNLFQVPIREVEGEFIKI